VSAHKKSSAGQCHRTSPHSPAALIRITAR
jgi:hypothetical protein